MRSLKEQIENKCIHFNGLMNKTCQAGMIYDEIDKGNRIPYRAKLPCFKSNKHLPKGELKCECPKMEFPSPEEVQRQLDKHKEYMEKMRLALEMIKPIKEQHKGQDWSGTLECPNCKGNLHISHAGYNGHVWVKCETENCVAWIE